MSTGTLGIWHRIRQSRLLSFQRLFTCQLKRSSIKDVGKLQGEVLKIPEIYRGINIKKSQHRGRSTDIFFGWFLMTVVNVWGKRLKLPKLSHESFLTIDDSCKIFF